jgi:prolyl oligopeptidase
MFNEHIRLCTAVLLAVTAAGALAPAPGAAQAVAPAPKAREAPATDEYFGTQVVDPYRWMETPGSMELLEWLKAQAQYTSASLERLPARKELLARIHALNQSVSDVYGIVQAGGRFFYFRADPARSVPQIMFRDGLDGSEKLLFDPATLAQAAGHAEAGWFAPSQDGRYLAIGISFGGAEEAGHLRVLDVDRGQLLDEDLPRVWAGPGDVSSSWLSDGRTFTYLQFPLLMPGQSPQERLLRSRSFLHTVGRNTDGQGDRPIFGFALDPAIALAKENLNLIQIAPQSDYAVAISETVDVDLAALFVAPVSALRAKRVHWTRVAGADDQIQSNASLEVHGKQLYVVSRKAAPRFRVLRIDLAHPDVRKAGVAVPESELVIENISAAADGLYILDLDGGLSGLRRLRWGTSHAEPVSLPFAGSIRAVYTHPASPGALLRMRSRTHPNVILRVDGESGASTDSGWQQAAKADFSGIDEREVMAIGHDGTRIPLSILIAKSAPLDSDRATLLDSYGAYGIFGTAKPYFDPVLLAWLERGGVFAVAHPRGGGEFGEEWHRGGMQQTKLNTVFDTIACAQYLVDHHYTSPRKLAVQGASAGGLVVGGAIAWRPELFAAAIDHAGMSDALRAETSANGPGNIPEFGSTRTAAGFHALYAMSPYHQLRDGVAYPAVLLETGVNDPRVDAWQMAKMTARLQAASTSGRPVLLRVDFDTGHFGGTTEQTEQLLADEWSFLLWQFKDPQFQPAR